MGAIGRRLRLLGRIVTALLALVVVGGAVAWFVSRDVRYLARAAMEETVSYIVSLVWPGVKK